MPEDLELTLEAFERAGDAAGAVALWEANLAALGQLDDTAGEEGATSRPREERRVYDARRVGLGGLGCEPTRRAWTSIIKAYCDAGEPVGAARLLEDAVRSARRAVSADSRARTGRKTKRGRNGRGGRRNERARVELVAFNLVASAFSRADEPRRAEAILRAMADDAAGDGVVRSRTARRTTPSSTRTPRSPGPNGRPTRESRNPRARNSTETPTAVTTASTAVTTAPTTPTPNSTRKKTRVTPRRASFARCAPRRSVSSRA